MSLFHILIFAALGIGPGAWAQEKAGEISVTEVLLRPTYLTKEKIGGEFTLSDSQFGVGWKLQPKLESRFLVGSLSQRQAPRYYQTLEAEDEIAFLEAYGEFEGIYGTLKMGLMPLPFSFENRVADRDLIFPLSQIFSERVIARRDFGLSMFTKHNGYFTEIMAHNGEVAEKASDGNVWATARWGWTDDRRLQVQLATQAGRTESDSTVNGDTAIGGFDISKSATWRFTQLSAHWFPRKWDVILEGLYGEVEQEAFRNQLMSYRLDLIHMLKPNFGLAARYDFLDLSKKVSDDGQTISSFALIFGGESDVSRVYVIASKKSEQGTEVPNDELRLVWRLRPYF